MDLLAKLEKITYSGLDQPLQTIEENTQYIAPINEQPITLNVEPMPPPIPKPDAEQKVNVCYVIRDKVYPAIYISDLLKLGFQLDSDVYNYDSSGSVNKLPLFKNRSRYIINSSFDNASMLNKYLREWGKIPEFLEVKPMEGRGFGIVTNRNLKKLTFLGFYQGQYRPINSVHSNEYGYEFKDFSATSQGYIDAENITFSNWTRFINDGDAEKYNVEFAVYNNQIYIFTLRDVLAGEEILGSYGEEYWKIQEAKGVKKLV
jgi:hypothetical protein